MHVMRSSFIGYITKVAFQWLRTAPGRLSIDSIANGNRRPPPAYEHNVYQYHYDPQQHADTLEQRPVQNNNMRAPPENVNVPLAPRDGVAPLAQVPVVDLAAMQASITALSNRLDDMVNERSTTVAQYTAHLLHELQTLSQAIARFRRGEETPRRVRTIVAFVVHDCQRLACLPQPGQAVLRLGSLALNWQHEDDRPDGSAVQAMESLGMLERAVNEYVHEGGGLAEATWVLDRESEA